MRAHVRMRRNDLARLGFRVVSRETNSLIAMVVVIVEFAARF